MADVAYVPRETPSDDEGAPFSLENVRRITQIIEAEEVPELSNYTVQRSLGKGASARVLLGHNKKDGVLYAMKQLRNVSKAPEAGKKLIHNEIIHTSRVSAHPYIVGYKETIYHQPSDEVYIVMEYCEGGTLKEKCASKPLDERTLLYFLVQICLAVKYLHDSGLVHRDLKAENVFLTKSATVRLGDFGIAREMEVDQLSTSLCGTPNYMSPEAITQRGYNEKTDVWSLGIVIYEMATGGRVPFPEKQNLHVLMAHIARSPPPSLPAHVSRRLHQLYADVLHKDPTRRPSINQVLATPIMREAFALLTPSHRALFDPFGKYLGGNDELTVRLRGERHMLQVKGLLADPFARHRKHRRRAAPAPPAPAPAMPPRRSAGAPLPGAVAAPVPAPAVPAAMPAAPAPAPAPAPASSAPAAAPTETGGEARTVVKYEYFVKDDQGNEVPYVPVGGEEVVYVLDGEAAKENAHAPHPVPSPPVVPARPHASAAAPPTVLDEAISYVVRDADGNETIAYSREEAEEKLDRVYTKPAKAKPAKTKPAPEKKVLAEKVTYATAPAEMGARTGSGYEGMPIVPPRAEKSAREKKPERYTYVIDPNPPKPAAPAPPPERITYVIDPNPPRPARAVPAPPAVKDRIVVVPPAHRPAPAPSGKVTLASKPYGGVMQRYVVHSGPFV